MTSLLAPDPAPTAARHTDPQAIHKGMELRPRQHPLARTPTGQGGEQPLLKTLGPDAEPARLEAQNLAQRLPAVDEDIPAPRQGIVPEVLPHQGLKAVKRLAHVGGIAGKPHPAPRSASQHQGFRRRRTVPSPKASSTSQAAVSGAATSTKAASCFKRQ